MQEEITQKTLALCVEASKMTAQLLQQAMKKVLADMEKHKKNPQLRHGKQTLRQLMKHNTGVSNIEITDQNIRAFSSTAKKYGLDFALKKDISGEHTRYLVFFKGRDADVITAAFREFSAKNLSREKDPSIDNDRENWVVFQNVHVAIIERAVYEQVQQKRGKIRKRRTNNGEHNMFSGLLVCADCGSNLHFHFNQGNPEIKYFNCSNYKGNRGTCTSTHYVRVDFLEEVVLGEIRRLTKFASLYEDEFVKAVIGHSQQAEQTDRKLKEKELKTLLARDEELDGLFERIYEDNVSGKLSDDRFAKMSRRYEDEQKELSEKIKKLRSEIEKQSSRSMTTDMFIGLVRKYTRARKLTPRMLNELVEKIEVFNAEKIDGVWEQRLRIHYNCVGTIEIPTVLPLPIPEVSINTRKGVVVNYAPCELAV